MSGGGPSLLGQNRAERVLSILISSAYRRNSLERMNLPACGPSLLSSLQRCVRRGSPIPLTVLAFPFKAPNPAKVGARRLPDFAELAAIRHFGAFRKAVQGVYPPGLEFHILHDGSLFGDVFGVELREVRRYEAYFAALVRAEDSASFIRCHDFGSLQHQSALDPSGAVEQLERSAKQWFDRARGTAEWKLRFRRTLGMLNLRDLPQRLAADLIDGARLDRPRGAERIEQRVQVAMMRYHVQDAIIHRFDPRPLCFPDAIHATTQDRSERLSIWMVRRGQSLLPWHGVGGLDERGRPRVVRAVDTSNRAEWVRMTISGETTPFAYVRRTIETRRGAGHRERDAREKVWPAPHVAPGALETPAI